MLALGKITKTTTKKVAEKRVAFLLGQPTIVYRGFSDVLENAVFVFCCFHFLSVHTNLKKTCGVLYNILCLFSKGHLNATPSLLYPWNLNLSRIHKKSKSNGNLLIYQPITAQLLHID